VTWTPACGQAGSYGPYTLKAMVPSGDYATVSFSVSVSHKVGTVTVDPISDPTVAETHLLTVTPSASLTSCAATPLTWSATGLPTGASINSSTGVITWTPDCLAFENGPNYGPVAVTAESSARPPSRFTSRTRSGRSAWRPFPTRRSPSRTSSP
jgi:hypothetical protein